METQGIPAATDAHDDFRGSAWERVSCTVTMVGCPRCSETTAHVEWTKGPSLYPLWFWKECMREQEPDTSAIGV